MTPEEIQEARARIRQMVAQHQRTPTTHVTHFNTKKKVRRGGEITDTPQVYAFIVAHKVKNQGNGPSFQEIADAMGYGSRTAVSPRLQALSEQGLIELGKKHHASQIKIVGASFVPPKG